MRISPKSFGMRKPDRSGVAAVEFALTLPLLMLIVVGCIDLGRFAYLYIAVTNAARDAASYAGSNASNVWNGQPQAAAVAELQNTLGGTYSAAQSTISVSGPMPDGTGGQEVSATVSYNFTLLCPAIFNLFPSPIPNPVPLTRTVVMPYVPAVGLPPLP